MGLKLQILGPLTSSEIDGAYATLAREPTDAVFVANAPFFTARRVQLSLLAMRHQIPAIYSQRQYVEAGGLISYGGSLQDTWRQVGAYTGRVLKGAKPADLPGAGANQVRTGHQPQTARTLGLDRAGLPARPRRRGDRITTLFAASAHSRFWHEAADPGCPFLRRILAGKQPRKKVGNPALLACRECCAKYPCAFDAGVFHAPARDGTRWCGQQRARIIPGQARFPR